MTRHDHNSDFYRHYRLPEDYFQKLESRMQERLVPGPRRILWRRRMLQAAAVLVVGLMAWPVYRNMHSGAFRGAKLTTDTVNLHVNKRGDAPSADETTIDLSDIPDDVIDDYLLMDDDDPLL